MLNVIVDFSLKLSLSESKEKNNVKLKDAIEEIKKKELEMKKLQQESARKRGELRAKIRLLLKANVKEIKSLHESSVSVTWSTSVNHMQCPYTV